MDLLNKPAEFKCLGHVYSTFELNQFMSRKKQWMIFSDKMPNPS